MLKNVIAVICFLFAFTSHGANLSDAQVLGNLKSLSGNYSSEQGDSAIVSLTMNQDKFISFTIDYQWVSGDMDSFEVDDIETLRYYMNEEGNLVLNQSFGVKDVAVSFDGQKQILQLSEVGEEYVALQELNSPDLSELILEALGTGDISGIQDELQASCEQWYGNAALVLMDTIDNGGFACGVSKQVILNKQ